MSSEKVAFNYLRENFTEPGQPIVHGLVNFKPQLVPDIPNVKFSGLEFKILEYWFDWSASGSRDSWLRIQNIANWDLQKTIVHLYFAKFFDAFSCHWNWLLVFQESYSSIKAFDSKVISRSNSRLLNLRRFFPDFLVKSKEDGLASIWTVHWVKLRLKLDGPKDSK